MYEVHFYLEHIPSYIELDYKILEFYLYNKDNILCDYHYMLSKTYDTEDYSIVISDITNFYKLYGNNIIRVKIETIIHNTIQMYHGKCYYESHIKLNNDVSIPYLMKKYNNSWYFSSNKLNNHRSYMTYRSNSLIDVETNSVFLISKEGFDTKQCELECILLDTNPDLDKDWIS